METVFVDTNIIIDLLARREPFYKDAQGLFTLSDNRRIHFAFPLYPLPMRIIPSLGIIKKLTQKNT